MATEERINVDHICRVEGHGSLAVSLLDGSVSEINLKLTEGARLFEAILLGRRYNEAASITSRICAICSAGHAVTSLMAMEDALEIEVTPQTELLRELLVLGQFIQSHSLHVYFLAAPDFLGYPSVIPMAADYPNEVLRALKLKKLGNDIADVVGGRAVHPIAVTLGGFSAFPKAKQLQELRGRLVAALDDAQQTVKLVASLVMPALNRRTEYLAIRGSKRYSFVEGSVHSSDGLIAPAQQYRDFIQEKTAAYTNSKMGSRNGKGFFVGALARVNVNHDQLRGAAKTALEESGVVFPSYNSFNNNLAQAIEIVYSVEQSIEIIDQLLDAGIKAEEPTKFEVREAAGTAGNEVPRGTLYHHYEIDKNGIIVGADVITPTAQNLTNVEEDMGVLVPMMIDQPREKIAGALESLVRAYDPCISCSVHFLDIKFLG
jgi:sulfhydrogenase subunit alpha